MATPFPITCDVCGELIHQPEHGMLAWFSQLGTLKVHDIRIVHHAIHSPQGQGRCCFHTVERAGFVPGDLHLSGVVGPDGIMDLLEMMNTRHADPERVSELLKRLFVPGYEQARHHISAAIQEGELEPNRAHGYYSSEQIKAVLKFAAANQGQD
ncbi:hypothetical protein [Mesoterricola sediminis]|nr:hypothetical protein [Mesoterricola sediminis]